MRYSTPSRNEPDLKGRAQSASGAFLFHHAIGRTSGLFQLRHPHGMAFVEGRLRRWPTAFTGLSFQRSAACADRTIRDILTMTRPRAAQPSSNVHGCHDCLPRRLTTGQRHTHNRLVHRKKLFEPWRLDIGPRQLLPFQEGVQVGIEAI